MIDRPFRVGCASHLMDELSVQESFSQINLRIVGHPAVSDHCNLNLGMMMGCRGSLHELTTRCTSFQGLLI